MQEDDTNFIKRMYVYDIVSCRDFRTSGRGRLIKGKWLYVNKGDSVTPDITRRHLGGELPTGVDASLYACTLHLRS